MKTCTKCGVPFTAHKYPFCPPDVQTVLDKALPRAIGYIPERHLDTRLPIIIIPGQMYEINGFLIMNKRPLEDTLTKVYVSGESICIVSAQPVEISIKRTA